MSQPVIRAEGLGKRYRRGVLLRYKTLRDAVAQRAAGLWRRHAPAADPAWFWALKDASFEAAPGEVLGVIGRNGAGKSTLLKLLARITEPTEGRAAIHGRVGSLLELGTGFHPELTGRENVYLSGAVLGLGRREIARRFDEIVAFAEIERFLETPIKHYSNGMYVRLAFAVAAHLEPEVLLVDEVLAVGDLAFQQKCLGKMGEVVRHGRTVLFVSHNLGAVRGLCSRVVWLEDGRIAADGAPGDVIQRYVASTQARAAAPRALRDRTDRYGTGRVRVAGVAVEGLEGASVRMGGAARIRVRYEAVGGRPLPKLFVAVGVTDAFGIAVFTCSTAMTRADFLDAPPAGQAVCQIEYLPLVPGRYSVKVKLIDGYEPADVIEEAAWFDVVEDGGSGFVTLPGRAWTGSVVVPHVWALEQAEDAGGGADRSDHAGASRR